MTTEGESEEATEQPNKSKENRKRNATINEREREREREIRERDERICSFAKFSCEKWRNGKEKSLLILREF